MRFFGNERDTTDRDDRGDEEPRDRVVTDEERPDHVRSAPVPVQRSAPQGVEATRNGEAAIEEQARGEDLTRLAAPAALRSLISCASR